jgi:DNA-binding CsgD family transcriptional regulator
VTDEIRSTHEWTDTHIERHHRNGALTPAERVVAGLVAEGLTNPQIADRLSISRHTAETHVKHIFAKVGVSSRAALAAMVASRQLETDPMG